MNGFAAFGGNGDPDEIVGQKLGDVIQHVHGDTAMLTRFVVLAETVEEDGTFISVFTSTGLKEWDAMGLLHWALSVVDRSEIAGSDDADDDG
jgi:hypothetical protein